MLHTLHSKRRSKGSLEKGKLADFVVLDQDNHEDSRPEKIRDVKVLVTVVGGKDGIRGEIGVKCCVLNVE